MKHDTRAAILGPESFRKFFPSSLVDKNVASILERAKKETPFVARQRKLNRMYSTRGRVLQVGGDPFRYPGTTRRLGKAMKKMMKKRFHEPGYYRKQREEAKKNAEGTQ